MATNNAINANSTTPLPIVDGGTQVTAVTIAPTATSFAGWDANKNLSANNTIEGYATTATAAGTTTLTVASAYQQFFTGSTTQTLVMPVTSTLVLGQSWMVVNNSTGVVTVESSGGNTITAMAAGTQALFTCILTSGTTATSWNSDYSLNTVGVSSVTGTANEVIASASTGAVTLSLPQAVASTSSPTFAALTLTNPYIAGAGGLHSFQIFTTGSAATYTKPSNVTSILVECIGGGGGGGGATGAATATSCAAGGGAGGYCRLYVASAAGTYTYTVGTGGAGGTAGNNNGSNGNATTFSASSMSAGGGNGGTGMASVSSATASTVQGGNGGTSSGGNINAQGGAGYCGNAFLGVGISGSGGDGYFGGGGRALTASGNNAGIAGNSPGAGGGGASVLTASEAGGAGANGIIIVWEFA
jgi:hypothetical protein